MSVWSDIWAAGDAFFDNRDLISIDQFVSNEIATLDFNHTNGTKKTVTLSASVNSTTGLISGGNLTAFSSTQAQIFEGSGIVVDYSDPLNPIVNRYNWPTFQFTVTATNFASIGIQDNGAGGYQLVQKNDDFFTPDEFRFIIVLGQVNNVGGTVTAYDNAVLAKNQSLAILDYIRKQGVFKSEALSTDGGSFQVNISEGEFSVPWINSQNNVDSPVTKEIPSQSPSNLVFTLRPYPTVPRWSIEKVDTTIITNLYDNGTGVLQTVANNKWLVHRILFDSLTETFVYQYPQLVYNSFDEARDGLLFDEVEQDPNLKSSTSILLCAIIIKTNETLSSNMIFFNSDERGKIGAGGSSASVIDDKFKLDALDTLNGYFLDKIAAGNGVNFTRTAGGSGDLLTINSVQQFQFMYNNNTTPIQTQEYFYFNVSSNQRSGTNGGLTTADISPLMITDTETITEIFVNVFEARSQNTIAINDEVGIGLRIRKHDNNSVSNLASIDARFNSASAITAGNFGSVDDTYTESLSIAVVAGDMISVEWDDASTVATNKLTGAYNIWVGIKKF